MKVKLKYVGMLALLLVALSFVPIGREVHVYRAVLSPTELKMEEHVVARDAGGSGPTADFLVQNGKLYLKFQSVRSSLLMVTYITDAVWNTERASALRSQHPELEGLWDKKNSGVYWLDN